ncbi:putative lipase/esterase from carbohydrate esterase family CE10 [Moesziomyces antarcticus]|uniref:Candidate lipase/esterase from carbohydrate esterase family CE10 n=2 Tax=Pseudozyma antarctica TaxID=84753 RepID=A0A081CLT2_PSEA2|nr:putative lipase/esterase from carbohydrate esterase family CE10 [Moesziomyces antarcticus]GAK67628.1 candidate lipase/esterase from carbohydrate esterase family CE10 [Moesziomyces antarcticus]
MAPHPSPPSTTTTTTTTSSSSPHTPTHPHHNDTPAAPVQHPSSSHASSLRSLHHSLAARLPPRSSHHAIVPSPPTHASTLAFALAPTHRFSALFQSRNTITPASAGHRRSSSTRQHVKMVGSHLHHAFRSWFKETEKDGTPLLPVALSKKYTVLPQVLGQGSFAVVKAVVEKATGQERALKIIAKKPLKDSNEKMLKEEITILGKVEHPNIIKMWDLYETREGVFIVTDLCSGGELFDRLVSKVHYNELDARHIMKQLLAGVAYLHDHDIIHRDLKPENILLRDKSDPSDVVISDFGLSRFIPDEGLLMTACGSPQYVSPEVLLGKGYDAAVDIWSCGVIAYALLGGYTPFYGQDQPSLFQQIIKMDVHFEPEYWSEVSDTAKDFILKCLCTADKRMTAHQALAHPWLADLPPLHEEASKGACLKNGALRNLEAMRKLRKAVTAVEAINHLQRLHALRQQNGDALPHKQQSLLSIATHLQSHKRGDSLLPSPTDPTPNKPLANADSSVTMTDEPAELTNAHKKERGDSAMALDLTVMMAWMPESWGRSGSGASSTPSQPGASGTAAVAQAAEDTLNRGREPASSSAANDVVADGQASPSASSTGHSETTVRPAAPPAASSSQPRRASRSTNRKDTESTKTLNSLLDQYKKTDVPASARLNPAIKVREPTKLSFTNAWRYLPFLVSQGVSIGTAVASHAIYGPPKKSWGIETSVFTRVLRDVAEYSEFASIEGLQQLFDLGAFLPTPKDGLITPVTFRVKKRGLRGFLAEADAAEDGKREISAEWVVGKQTWRRLQAEWRSGKQKGKERVILYIHGGAYFVMSAATHRPLTISLSKYTECRVFGINYRLAPETKFPGALHDCVASYFRLTDDLGIPPSNIVLGADSAGGGLALALMYYLRDNDYPLPSGAMLFSPWVDLTMSCDSWDTNAEFDYLPMPKSGDHMNPVWAYLGDNIDKYLTHPYVSPLFGDMHGLPPLLIQCGDAEVLRDEVTLLAHKASLSGVAVRHELYEDCVHVFQAFLFLDASRKALQSARHFVRTALDKRGKSRDAAGQQRSEAAVNKEMAQGNMQTPQGAKADPATGEKQDAPGSTSASTGSASAAGKGKMTPSTSSNAVDGGIDEIVSLPHSRSDGDVDDDDDDAEAAGLPADEEDWDLEGRVSGEERRGATGADAPKPQGLAAQAAQKVLGADDKAVTEATSQGAAEGDEQEKQGSSGWDASFPQMTIEEARLRGQAGMQQQLSSDAPALSKFHAPQKPLTPKMRRSSSGKELSTLLKSFESGGSTLKTNVWTPNTN